jgi:hypothetical protein
MVLIIIMISTSNSGSKFENLGLPMSEKVYSLPEERQRDIYSYLSQLSDHEKKAYIIAYQHLGTSFDILRSNGFCEWKKLIEKL